MPPRGRDAGSRTRSRGPLRPGGCACAWRHALSLAPLALGKLVLPQPPLAGRGAARLRAEVRRPDRVRDRLADGLVRLGSLVPLALVLSLVRHVHLLVQDDVFAAAFAAPAGPGGPCTL